MLEGGKLNCLASLPIVRGVVSVDGICVAPFDDKLIYFGSGCCLNGPTFVDGLFYCRFLADPAFFCSDCDQSSYPISIGPFTSTVEGVVTNLVPGGTFGECTPVIMLPIPVSCSSDMRIFGPEFLLEASVNVGVLN